MLGHEIPRQSKLVGIVQRYECRWCNARIVWHRWSEINEERLAAFMFLEETDPLVRMVPHVVWTKFNGLHIDVESRVAIAACVVRLPAVVANVTGFSQHARE